MEIRLSSQGLSVVGAIVSLVVVACSSGSGNDGNNAAASKSNGSGGAAAGSGGASAGVGTSAASGGSVSTDAGDLYSCLKKPLRDPGGTGKAHDACCPTALGKVGECTATSDVADPTLRAALGHDSCAASAGLVCAPNAALLDAARHAGADAGNASDAATGPDLSGYGIFDPCRSTLGGDVSLEGRCLPKCFTVGIPQSALLHQDGCSSPDIVCAPCFNPINGSETGACRQRSGDTPKESAVTFAPCGLQEGGPPLGLCIPTTVVNAAGTPLASKVRQHECKSSELCVPNLKARDLDACFDKCTVSSSMVTQIVGNAFGACVPGFVVYDVEPVTKGFVAPDGCSAGEVCAPCTDPISQPPGPSGACE
jgi:hypothetical protein